MVCFSGTDYYPPDPAHAFVFDLQIQIFMDYPAALTKCYQYNKPNGTRGCQLRSVQNKKT